MDRSLEIITTCSTKRYAAYESGHGKPLTEFIRKQPAQQIQEPVFHSEEKLKLAEQNYKEVGDKFVDIRCELAKIRSLNDGIKSNRKHTQQLEERAKKTTKAVEKAETKLGQLRSSKPGSPEMQKAQTEYDTLAEQKKTDIENFERRQAQLKEEEDEYRQNLSKLIIHSMDLYATKKIASCEYLIKLSDELEQCGNQISTYEDPKLERIRSRIESLKSEQQAE
ncbi:hypothetical protein GPJ56_008304 [Histomonas meleagridis]|uniref:uncharacterized protein n=1 Tax=Histomonas meleagridis TaxID=135588 RepID=UPI00355A53FC|nr:hypothetical protein GPJ56_008304 [Histomonas meleagridis]KAH0806875.1 hypothetical protein GO595_000051 [Histomonas meleagridis]